MSKTSEVYVYLMPRETEMIMRPAMSEGEHGQLLRRIQAKVDVPRNDVTLTGADVLRIRAAVKYLGLGYEQQFKALATAIDRCA